MAFFPGVLCDFGWLFPPPIHRHLASITRTGPHLNIHETLGQMKMIQSSQKRRGKIDSWISCQLISIMSSGLLHMNLHPRKQPLFHFYANEVPAVALRSASPVPARPQPFKSLYLTQIWIENYEKIQWDISISCPWVGIFSDFQLH